MESKDRIPRTSMFWTYPGHNDRYEGQIRKILELPDHQSFSIVRWYSPAEVKPIEATYVMAKLYEPGIGFICIGAAYEHGRFWELDPLKDKPLEIVRVLAWSYPPWMTVLMSLDSCNIWSS